MIISISGPAGSGKSTVAKELAKKLKYERYYMGGLRRDAAKKRGMTIEEYNAYAQTDPATDLEVDLYQKELGETKDDFIIEGRTSYHFIPQSIKIFLDVETKVAAHRIFSQQLTGNERNEEKFSTVEEVEKDLAKRDHGDAQRFKNYLDIDIFDTKQFDLVIDTTSSSVKEVLEKIVAFIEEVQHKYLNEARLPFKDE